MDHFHVGTFKGSAAYRFVQESNIAEFVELRTRWEKNPEACIVDTLQEAKARLKQESEHYAIIVESPVADYMIQVC